MKAFVVELNGISSQRHFQRVPTMCEPTCEILVLIASAIAQTSLRIGNALPEPYKVRR